MRNIEEKDDYAANVATNTTEDFAWLKKTLITTIL